MEFENSIKTFFCEDCQREVQILKWKSISENLNKGAAYKCDDCWEKFDNELNSYLEVRMSDSPKRKNRS